jgi:hypothetical protein
MIIVATAAVLCGSALVALWMVLRDATPSERPEILAAVASIVRAWRSRSGSSGRVR